MIIHRIREPKRPTDLGEFVAWVERMNSDMLAAGVELGDRYSYDLVHGHDWLVANACDHLAKRFEAPLVTTIHATEYGRHQGWVDKHPQTYIHGVERWITNRSNRVITCSHYMREQVADIFGVEEGRISVIPNGIDPDDLPEQPAEDLARLRSEFAAPEEKLVLLIGRLVYEKGFQLALEAMPRVIEEAPGTRFLVAGSGTHEAELKRQAAGAGADGPRHLPRLDRRRRAALALPDRRPHRGPLDLRALRPGGAGGDGLRLPLHRRRHRRPARGRPARGSRVCASAPTTPKRWPRSRSASSPTTSSAAAWSPKPTSTCAASTGATSPSRPPPSTPTWPARRRPSGAPSALSSPRAAAAGCAR